MLNGVTNGDHKHHSSKHKHKDKNHDKERRKETTLSEHIWSIQDQNLNCNLIWKIFRF